MQEVDDEFYERADAHIHLSNGQISEKVGTGKVSASNMYATARFNAWVSAGGVAQRPRNGGIEARNTGVLRCGVSKDA